MLSMHTERWKLAVAGFCFLSASICCAVLTLQDGATNLYTDVSLWDGGVVDGVVTGSLTEATMLVVPENLDAPNGLSITALGGVKPALTVCSDLASSREIRMGGPLRLRANVSHSTIIRFGTGGGLQRNRRVSI